MNEFDITAMCRKEMDMQLDRLEASKNHDDFLEQKEIALDILRSLCDSIEARMTDV